MNLFSFTLVAACAATGSVKIQWPRIFSFAAMSLVIVAAALLGTRFILAKMVTKEDLSRRTLMQSEIADPKAAYIYKIGSLEEFAHKSPLESIIKRGRLRVGYHPENLPFSFINDKGDLVGFDVELMHLLARELDVDIDFVEWTYDTLFADLNNDKFDLAIGGLIVNPERLARANFSNPYMKLTTSIVVEDHRRNEFGSWEKIDEESITRLGVVGEGRADHVQRQLPNTDVVLLETYSDFFVTRTTRVDGLVISAEAGSAWTILFPAYSVVLPEPHEKTYAALAIPLEKLEFENFINDWLNMKQAGGVIDSLYSKWILGEEAQQKQVRWSVGRDVFDLWE